MSSEGGVDFVFTCENKVQVGVRIPSDITDTQRTRTPSRCSISDFLIVPIYSGNGVKESVYHSPYEELVFASRPRVE